jgi:hypothetical protein
VVTVEEKPNQETLVDQVVAVVLVTEKVQALVVVVQEILHLFLHHKVLVVALVPTIKLVAVEAVLHNLVLLVVVLTQEVHQEETEQQIILQVLQ